MAGGKNEARTTREQLWLLSRFQQTEMLLGIS